jgi:aspartyl-tRNA(Asn)/glutamyl-tRNA(Gln) amidotransferase subunit A
MNSLDIPTIDSMLQTVERIKAKEIKVTDLVKEHLDRAHKINPDINAFITILDDALAKAEELDKRIEANDPEVMNLKLLGIPFTVKDLYLVEGTKTTFSSKFMEDFVAPYTSTVAQKCLDEGAILLGKCNSDPWGFGGSGENSGFGPTKHPLDFTRTPGGSSSGSAASLLAGVGFFALGTDTGGSVRLPASFCGLYGIKPTYGRNSRYGIGAMGSSFDTPGFFTRNISDMKVLEEIMAGKDINDATTSEVEYKTTDARNNTDKLRVGIPKEFFTDEISADVKTSLDQFVESLRSNSNVELVEISLPSAKYALPVYYILVPAEISSNRARYDGVRFGKKVSDNYEENIFASRSKYFEDEVKRRILIGTYSLSKGYSDQYYKQASKVRAKIVHEFEEAFKSVDIILSPVSPLGAFKLGEKISDPVQMYLVDVYTVTANITGNPALSIPVGKDSNGLPVGIQLIGSKFSEQTIFSAAEMFTK